MAWRWLRSRKSHGAVGAIAAVSMAGVAVATAAIVCVLSVFNGFRNLITEGYGHMLADITVTTAQGKAVEQPATMLATLAADPDVTLVVPVLTDNALAIMGNREMPVTLKGVEPDRYARLTRLDSIMYPGGRAPQATAANSAALDDEEFYDPDAETAPAPLTEAAVSVGVASQLGIERAGVPLTIFVPRRTIRLNPSNPLESFVIDSLAVTGVYHTGQSEYDDNLVVCDINTARGLFLRGDSAVSGAEASVRSGTDPARVAARLQSQLGPQWKVTDRMGAQTASMRMVAIEKWVSFLLLGFILAVASFNIVSTMSMLVLEKQKSMPALRAMGFSLSDVGSVFRWESAYVTALGAGIGLVAGAVLSLLQQHFGFIKLAGDPGTLSVEAYPVALEWSDLLIAAVPVLLIGAATAWTASAFARSRAATQKQ